MAKTKGRWTITAEKFLSLEQVGHLRESLLNNRDLAFARANNAQAVRDYYGVLVILESGLRVFEFCALTNGDFHGLKLTVRKGKGDKPRTVLLTKTTANMIKEWFAVKARLGHSLEHSAPLFPSRYGTTYTTRGVQKRVKLIFATLGFPARLSVHSLRHTYCSLLLASGKVGIGTVRDNLGHHSLTVTNLYAHAIGDLSDLELYPAPSSHNSDLCEPHGTTKTKKANNSVNGFLRNMNFKHRV